MTEKRTSGVNVEMTAHLTTLDAAGEAAMKDEIEQLQRGKKRQIDFLARAYPTIDAEALEPEELQAIIDSLPEAISFCADKLPAPTREFLDQHLDRLSRWFAGDKVSKLAKDDKISQGHVGNWKIRLAKQIRASVSKQTLMAISQGELQDRAETQPKHMGGIAINGAAVELGMKQASFRVIGERLETRPDRTYRVLELAPVSPKALPASGDVVTPRQIIALNNLIGPSDSDPTTEY